MIRNRVIQLTCVAVAAGLLACAGMMHPVLDEVGGSTEDAQFERVVNQKNPELALLTTLPGAFRPIIVNWLWIRANEHKENGRYYDAYQLAEAICKLQPQSPGVWYFHAWNMAWNISAATHTPEERWLWVSNGMRLLRDRGIPYNPRSIYLYKELGWIFLNKMGGTIDEMHWAYKRNFALDMHRLLAAPPPGDTQAVIDGFARIAEAPIDRDPLRKRETGVFQTDVLRRELIEKDPQVAEYVRRLEEVDVRPDRSLLEAYMAWSNDPEVTVAEDLRKRPRPSTDLQKARSELINDPAFSDPRMRLLSWVRAQVLWNEHKMDPVRMLELMKEYNVPLDWRLPWPHGLYWVERGMDRAVIDDPTAITPLNTNRELLTCMKDLSTYGILLLKIDHDDPSRSRVSLFADSRYILPTHRAYVRVMEEYIEAAKRLEDRELTIKDVPLKSGHINYLRNSLLPLLTSYQWEEANEIWTYLKSEYEMSGEGWDYDNPLDMVVAYHSGGETPTPEQARRNLTAALRMALYELARGNTQAYDNLVNRVARPLYEVYEKDMPVRNRLGPFGALVQEIAAILLADPARLGLNLTMQQRGRLWDELRARTTTLPGGMTFSLAAILHDAVEGYLRLACDRGGYRYEALFPPPADLEAFRQWRRRQAPQL